MVVKQCRTCMYHNESSCFEAPPTATLVPVRTVGGDGAQVVALRPPVKATDYCSRWVAQDNLVT